MEPTYPIDQNSYHSVQSYDTRIQFLIMHYTAEDFQKSIRGLATSISQVSAHYLVPDPTDPTYKEAGFKDMRIINLVKEENRAWHAGISGWENKTSLNDVSIGIENVNLATETTFPPYNPIQIQAIIQLARNILQRYPHIDPTHVLGHSDIAFKRKVDPGPEFPWYTIYQNGIGAWPNDEDVAKFTDKWKKEGLPAKTEIIASFKKYGYYVDFLQSQQDYDRLVRMFQMHFRPENYDGKMDIETCAILYALNQKYKTSVQEKIFSNPSVTSVCKNAR